MDRHAQSARNSERMMMIKRNVAAYLVMLLSLLTIGCLRAPKDGPSGNGIEIILGQDQTFDDPNGAIKLVLITLNRTMESQQCTKGPIFTGEVILETTAGTFSLMHTSVWHALATSSFPEPVMNLSAHASTAMYIVLGQEFITSADNIGRHLGKTPRDKEFKNILAQGTFHVFCRTRMDGLRSNKIRVVPK
jgi:hypothetical protein